MWSTSNTFSSLCSCVFLFVSLVFFAQVCILEWHSSFKLSHIVHKGAYWNDKQCCLRKFSFSLDEKSIFHILSAQYEVFCEGPIIYFCKIGPYNFYKKTRPYLVHNLPNGWVSKNLIHLRWKREIFVDSVGSGSNLNYSCLIVCSLFFPKIISRYKSIYLIRETPKKFRDSTTS